MKVKPLFLLPLFVLFLYGCEDSQEVGLSLSQTLFSAVSCQGETLKITVNTTSSKQWNATSSVDWCTPSPTTGYNGTTLQISVKANPEVSERSGSVVVRLGNQTKSIEITQEAGNGDMETYFYELPVIFHVFYQNQNSDTQYVKQSRLSSILNVVNQLYTGSTSVTDMNMKFALATTDESGKQLDTPGVEYIHWTETYPIDWETFMNDNSGKYVKYLWEPNEYVNVMVYNFAEKEGGTTLGVSHLPFSTQGSTYLEGLNEISYTDLTKENLNFAYCVSLNSIYINEQSTEALYNSYDVTVTLAHELGHYLGLFHVFSETEEGVTTDNCEDTDYCKDTPSYDYEAYNEFLLYTYLYDYDNYTFSNLVKRMSCEGEEFTSTNLMDYAVSYSDRFTDNQRSRVRHVLQYSPLIPGPKTRSETRSRQEGVLDLPIQLRK